MCIIPKLLWNIFPIPILESLLQFGKVAPVYYDMVTIFFMDIVTFTPLSAQLDPMAVYNFLDNLYTQFDREIDNFNVMKIETIGDSYMVAGGLRKNSASPEFHAESVAVMALAFLRIVNSFPSNLLPLKGMNFQVRMGIHSGPVVAGVAGFKGPRYCLFGDTVNTANRMESNSAPNRILISETTAGLLKGNDRQRYSFDLLMRDTINVKGKGSMKTYWLTKRDEYLFEPEYKAKVKK